MIDELVQGAFGDYSGYLEEVVQMGVEFFVGGMLAAFIAWAVGFAVYTMFDWLRQWTN